MTTYTPPQPIATFTNFKDLWKNWGSKQINKGKTLEVSLESEGPHYVLQYNGKEAFIYSSDSSINKANTFPQIVEELKKIGPVILEVNLENNKVHVFDCVQYKEKDLTDLPLRKRRTYLKEAIKNTSFITSTSQLCNSKASLEKTIVMTLGSTLSKKVMIKVHNSTFKFDVNPEWVEIKDETIQKYSLLCSPYYQVDRMQKRVVKRGDKWCVVHAHPKVSGSTTDRAPGTPIKCYTGPDAKVKAERMHRAIIYSQYLERTGQKSLIKYGTSEGAMRAWDTRGRGRKTSPSSTSSIKQNLIDIAPYEGKDGEYVPLTVDQTKFKGYIDVVQKMDDIALAIEAGSPNKEVLQAQLLKLNIERSKLHEGITEEAVNRLSKENPKLPIKIITTLIHTAVGEAADRYITHKRAKDTGTA